MFCLTSPTEAKWKLPLSSWAGEYFASRLAGIEAPFRATRRTMLLDPALTLWCLAQPDWEATEFCIERVSQWLGAQSAASLRSRLVVEQCDDDREWKIIARASVKAAIQRVEKIRHSYSQPSSLRALLHNCHRWFAVNKACIQDLPLPDALRGKVLKKRQTDKRRRKSVTLPRGLRIAIQECWLESPPSPWPMILSEMLRQPNSSPADEETVAAAPVPCSDSKLEALKQLAYGASHEINNPLANISTRAQLLMAQQHGADLQRHFEAINKQAFRAHEMIADLMLFANPPKLDKQKCDLDKIIQDVVAEFQDTLPADASLLFHENLTHTPIHADTTQLAVAIQALIRNSAEAMRNQGSIWISCQPRHEGNGATPKASIVVRDNGPGIEGDARKHLFDPFFSGREAGRGLGFGLSKAWRIATLHGGSIQANCPADGGTQFELTIADEKPEENSVEPRSL